MAIDLRIDGDALVYMAGHAADSRSSELSHSLHNLKLIIEKIYNACEERYLPEPVECSVLLTSISSKDNFRFDVSSDYKANRLKVCRECKGTEFTLLGIKETEGKWGNYYTCDQCGTHKKDSKPIHYTAMRQYLVDKFSATVVDWGEADDWLCTDVTPSTVIASNDKDLLMVPGTHYKISKEIFIEVSDPGMLFLEEKHKRKELKGFGFKWFCAQLLLGDAVDNIIKPVKGQGPVQIFEILNPIEDMASMFWKVYECYEAAGKKALFHKNCKLLWMARKPNQIFSLDILYELTGDDQVAEEKDSKDIPQEN